MIVQQIANSGDDEFYTPDYAIYPIVKYIKKGASIWCPFDGAKSNFVKILKGHDCSVFATHISEGGGDFFSAQIPNCDYIISNPPYSLKTEVLEKLFQIGKPFAMLLGVVGIFESQRRFDMFRHNKFEIMYLNRRVSYFKDYMDPKPSLNPPFQSVYICSGILPKQIVFEEIKKNVRKINEEEI